MKNHDTQPSFWTRLAMVPAVLGLISTSVIVGYASNDIWPNREQVIKRAAYTISQDDTRGIDNPHPAGETPAQGSTSDPIADYKAALALIRTRYYGQPVDAQKTRKLTYEAIRGLLGGLRDQFTSFLDPDEWAQMQSTTKGDFEGVGTLLQPDGHDIVVVEPIEGSPAEKAGVQAGDIIVRVNGKSVVGKTINDVVKLIKGKPGSGVRIGFLRGKTPLEFHLNRAMIVPPVVKFGMEDTENRIGYIRLSEFNERSVEQLDHAFEELKRQGMRGLVFDLRGNPGGLLDVAIQIASAFIPRDYNRDLNNVVVYIQEGSGQETRKTLRSENYRLNRIPLTVLVDDGSASASEIVSGAIKDYAVGTLIGERTYGKGRVQTLFPLDDNSALRLTTALYFPPRHCDINFKHDEDGNRVPKTGGILPDVEVAQASGWKGFKDKANDAPLQRALQTLRTNLNGVTTAQKSANATPSIR